MMDTLSDSELSVIPSPPDVDMSESVYSSGFEPSTSQLSNVESLSFSSQLSSSGSSQLPTTSSVLFTKNLFTRTLLNTDPPTVRYTCTQPQCKFFLKQLNSPAIPTATSESTTTARILKLLPNTKATRYLPPRYP